MKKKQIICIIALLISFNILLSNIAFVNCNDRSRTLASLTIRTKYGEHFDYALHIAKFLKSIGIKVRIQVKMGSDDGFPVHDFDLSIIEIKENFECTYQDMIKIYSEEGKLRKLGWTREIPYCESSEELLRRYWVADWMTIIMDKILPILPLFITKNNASIVFLAFNLRRPFIGGNNNYIFSTEPNKEEYTRGVSVRKAIYYCIDKEEMNIAINEGLYNITSYPCIDTTGGILESGTDIETQYYRDLEKAKEWLTAAGYEGLNENSFVTSHSIISLIIIGTYFFISKKRRKRISA